MNASSLGKKLFQRPVALLTLGWIILCVFLAVFAAYIAPDASPNANTMHLAIHSKPPGFRVMMASLPNTKGEEQETIPVDNYQFKNDQLLVHPVGKPSVFTQAITLTEEVQNLAYPEQVQSMLSTATFVWGTDKYGRDVFSRMLFGARISLLIGFVAVLISLLIGVLLGGLAGYFGGRIDAMIQWLINVFWSIPSLLMVIAITLALGKGFWQVFVAVGLSMWVDVARLVRGQVIAIKSRTFIEAGQVLGFSGGRLFIHHIFSLLLPSLIVISTANFASAILIESGLSFLGIGVQPPVPSWGGMIKNHFPYLLMGNAFLALLPGAAIVLLVLAFMLLGNALRDMLDVKN